MAEIKRQFFERHLRIIRDWTARRDEGMLLSSFYHLTKLDREKNLDLWQELREILAENEDLHSDRMRDYLHFPEEAAEGHWWFDPSRWTAEEEPAPPA